MTEDSRVSENGQNIVSETVDGSSGEMMSTIDLEMEMTEDGSCISMTNLLGRSSSKTGFVNNINGLQRSLSGDNVNSILISENSVSELARSSSGNDISGGGCKIRKLFTSMQLNDHSELKRLGGYHQLASIF